MTILKEGQILIEPDGSVTVTKFEIKGGTLYELQAIAIERVLLAAEKIQKERDQC